MKFTSLENKKRGGYIHLSIDALLVIVLFFQVVVVAFVVEKNFRLVIVIL